LDDGRNIEMTDDIPDEIFKRTVEEEITVQTGED
jgi:hypothetical protein